MKEQSLKTAQIAAIITAVPAALAFWWYYSELIHPYYEELSLFLIFLVFAATGAVAAAAYLVSLVMLGRFWFHNRSVGNLALTLAAIVLPAAYFVAVAACLLE